MTEPKHRPELRAPSDDEPITRNEIMDVLADEGYSADSRKDWLKKVLTRLVTQQSETPSSDQQHLIDEIKAILRRQVPGDPKAEDTL